MVVTWSVPGDTGDTVNKAFKAKAKAAGSTPLAIGSFKQVSYTSAAASEKKTTTKSASNIKVVVEDESTNFPIMIISLLVAIAVLGVIGVVCVKHKSGLGGGGKGSEPAHVEMEVI